jgi:hypothetical protein
MHRRYNRWHARFDQPDPYDGSYDLTNPQSFNRYSYVQNDPVNFVDPTGLDGVDDLGPAPPPPTYVPPLPTGPLDVITTNTSAPRFGGGAGPILGGDTNFVPVEEPEANPGGGGPAPQDPSQQDSGPPNDCLVFAAMVDIFASESSTDSGFIKTVYDRFKDKNDHSFVAGGFRPAFIDPTGESPNQVRHAAGAIAFGYSGGVAAQLLPPSAWGDAGNRTLEIFNQREKSYTYSLSPRGMPRRTLLPTTPGQQADMNLNRAALPIGFLLGLGLINRSDVGNLIRQNICNPQ